MQIGVDAAIALRRDAVSLARGTAGLCGERALVFGTLLVVVGVEMLEGATIDELWHEPWFVAGHSRQRIDS